MTPTVKVIYISKNFNFTRVLFLKTKPQYLGGIWTHNPQTPQPRPAPFCWNEFNKKEEWIGPSYRQIVPTYLRLAIRTTVSPTNRVVCLGEHFWLLVAWGYDFLWCILSCRFPRERQKFLPNLESDGKVRNDKMLGSCMYMSHFGASSDSYA